MAYNEALAGRIRKALDGTGPITERKMFGGLAFMLAGNMVCGVIGDDMMARVGPERYDDALSTPGAKLMDFTGRPMKGMITVTGPGLATDDAMRGLIDMALEYTRSLPPK